jgi:hypothetical protein
VLTTLAEGLVAVEAVVVDAGMSAMKTELLETEVDVGSAAMSSPGFSFDLVEEEDSFDSVEEEDTLEVVDTGACACSGTRVDVVVCAIS